MMVLDMMFISLQAVACALATCELGQQTTNACGDEIDDIFAQIDWYLYPAEVKRILPTAIQYIQQPIGIKFFGSLTATHEQFLRVSRGCTPNL